MNDAFHWNKNIEDEHVYIEVRKDLVVFGHVFDGGKTIIETKCSTLDFLQDRSEVKIRIKEYFGMNILGEVEKKIKEIIKK